MESIEKEEQVRVEPWAGQHLVPGRRDKGVVHREENKRGGILETRKIKGFK